MVDFADRDRPDPDLSGEASIGVGATQIFVAVSGQAFSPNIQLTSLPPMSQTDILSTIIFGQPARSLSQDQSSALSAQAAALLGQAGAGEIRKIVGSELAPDVVTVHTEGQTGSSLEAGKYLSSDLYLRYRRRMTEEGGQNIGLEYRLRDWLSLESQVGDTRDTGVDVILNFDF
jgi:translocation and assembly module TamB